MKTYWIVRHAFQYTNFKNFYHKNLLPDFVKDYSYFPEALDITQKSELTPLHHFSAAMTRWEIWGCHIGVSEHYCLLQCDTCLLLVTCLTYFMEAVHSSETLVNFYQTLWCHNPEESTIHYTMVWQTLFHWLKSKVSASELLCPSHNQSTHCVAHVFWLIYLTKLSDY